MRAVREWAQAGGQQRNSVSLACAQASLLSWHRTRSTAIPAQGQLSMLQSTGAQARALAFSANSPECRLNNSGAGRLKPHTTANTAVSRCRHLVDSDDNLLPDFELHADVLPRLHAHPHHPAAGAPV